MDIHGNISIPGTSVLSTDDAAISTNLYGTIIGWNPAAEKVFGYSANEALGKDLSIITPAELLSEEKKIFSRLTKGERIEPLQRLRIRKDGSCFLALISISALKDESDQIIGVSEIVHDITGDTNPEETQSLLAAIVDSSDDAIVSKDLDGIITSWNKGAERIFGYTAAETTGKHISIIIPVSKLDEEAFIMQTIRRGERVNHIETIRKRKDGKEIDISLTISPIKNKNGRITGASKIGRDISERVEMEKQKKLIIEKLQELNHYKDEFMAMASHELKTPLTVVKANLQVLELVLKTPEQFDFLNKASSQLSKLSNLITDLFDVAKIQVGKLELNISNFNLLELTKEVAENIQHVSQQHKIIINTTDSNIMVAADKERIEQVIVNMLTNAIKYSPHAKEVMVEVGIKNMKAVLQVKDRGIGINQENLDKLFNRFFRVRGLASTFSGSGMGLYISHEIIKRHRGAMWVESEPGVGSVFYFSLPLNKP